MDYNNNLPVEKWVDAKTVRNYFQMPKSTFENWFRRGMPCLRLAKARRFKISEVEKWLKEQHEVCTEESK